MAMLRCTGRIGGCRFKTGAGDIHLDQAGPLDLRAGAGDITVGRAAGSVEVSTGTGAVGIGSVDGTAVVKNSNGDTWIGEVTGDVRVNAANGRITIDRAGPARPRRPPTATCASARSNVVPSSSRARPARSMSGFATASPPGWTSRRGSATFRTTCRPPTALPRTRRRSTCVPGPPTAISPSVAASRTTPEAMKHDHHDISIRDRGHGAAQILRRQGRARRHRPGRRRGNDLRPARPQRRREDHRRADPVHLDRVRWRPRSCRGPRPLAGPRRGARRDRCHRAVLRGRQPPHRRGEPEPHGGPAPPGSSGWAGGGPPSCSSSSTWWRRG